MKIVHDDQLKITFTSPWGIFSYEVMSFEICKARATFQRLMNKIFEPYLGHIVRGFIDDFGIYGDRTLHLKKLKNIFNRLDET